MILEIAPYNQRGGREMRIRRLLILSLLVLCLGEISCFEKKAEKEENECKNFGGENIDSLAADEWDDHIGCILVKTNVKKAYISELGFRYACGNIAEKICLGSCKFYEFLFENAVGDCVWQFEALGYSKKTVNFQIREGKLTTLDVELKPLPKSNMNGYLLFNSGSKLYSVSPDGSGLIELADNVLGELKPYHFSPNGKFFVYLSCAQHSEDGDCVSGKEWIILELKSDNNILIKEIARIPAYGGSIGWSSDSRSFAFVESNGHVSIYYLESGEIIPFFVGHYNHSAYYFVFSWDDQFVVMKYRTCCFEGGDDYNDLSLKSMDEEKLDEEKLLIYGAGSFTNLQWLDNQALVYDYSGGRTVYIENDGTQREEMERRGLYTFNVNKNQAIFRKYLSSICFNMRLSPDKKKIVCDSSYFSKVVIIDVGTWKEEIVFDLEDANGFQARNLAWSPDSTAVALHSFGLDVRNSGISYLYILDLAGNLYRVLELEQGIDAGGIVWIN